VNPGAHEGYVGCFLKYTGVLLIVNSGKRLVGDRAKTTIYVRGKDTLSFEKWIFLYDQQIFTTIVEYL
jgi:hypothetical protein